MAEFAGAVRRQPPRRELVRILAFLGRYGHQPLDAMLSQPVSLLSELADEVSAVMADEKGAFDSMFTGGGGG